MTRKHFEAVARSVKQIDNLRKRRATALELADTFKKINPRFCVVKWMSACNVPLAREVSAPIVEVRAHV